MTFTNARFQGQLVKEKSDFDANLFFLRIDSSLELEVILPKSKKLNFALLGKTSNILASGRLITHTSQSEGIKSKFYKLLAKDVWSLQEGGLEYLVEQSSSENTFIRNKDKQEKEDLREILLEETEEEIPF